MYAVTESCLPLVAQSPHARSWINKLCLLGRSNCTIDGYARALESFFQFCAPTGICPETASNGHVLAYLRSLDVCEGRRNAAPGDGCHQPPVHQLATATLRLRLTAMRRYFEFLRCKGIRSDNPLQRGNYTLRSWLSVGRHELARTYRHLPWIPTADQWAAYVGAARDKSRRNRLMLALAYDTALSPGELCVLRTSDFSEAHRAVWVQAAVADKQLCRFLPYSCITGWLYLVYLEMRRHEAPSTHNLLLSASQRNRGQPITPDACRIIFADIAERAGIPEMTTRAIRHVRLLDLARAGWSVGAIAAFAGLPSSTAAMPYLRLCERELLIHGPQSVETLAQNRLGLLVGDLAAVPSITY